MKNKELMPCPFCGGEVSIALMGLHKADHYWFITRGKGVSNNCVCRVFFESTTFHKDDIETKGEKRKNKLIKAWNARANKIFVGNGEDYEVVNE